MFKPIAWAMIDEDGQFIDAIHPDEHARIEGDYKHPVYIASQQPTIDKSAAIRIATALGWEPKREPPTPREVKDTLRATGLLTNSQAWDVAEEVMKLLATHGIKEKNT